ncbi:hypothetical protein [Nonomuraea sp. NPDC050310]|uniref:hypothetical protein n=1 Tax=Nonomuraea sp. NPDC050310 TaxID=3154935 RepID=UPI0033F2AFDD
MTLTGTFVLAYTHASDTLEALANAALGTAALGLLLRYLTRPPAPGACRESVAESYGVSIGQMRAGHAELAASGHLLQARRSVGQGRWQHLIVVTDTPERLPATHEAWVLLDASLAAEQAHISPETAHVTTCDNAEEPQVVTSAEKPHIEPVTPFSCDLDPSGVSVVATVQELTRLAALPPLEAPTNELADIWLTPGQVLSLLRKFPARYGDLALGFLAKRSLPWYLAPRVVALLVAGYDTGQLGRALVGIEEGGHPVALARWRLDRLLLEPEPDQVAWRPPSTFVPVQTTPPDPVAASARGAALARAGLRARGLPA